MLFLIRHISSPCTILLTLCRYRLVCQNLSYIMKPKQGSKCSLASTKLGRSVTSTILDGISLLMHPKMTLPLLEAIPKISKTSGRNQVPKTGKRRWCSYPHYIDQKIEAWRGVTCWWYMANYSQFFCLQISGSPLHNQGSLGPQFLHSLPALEYCDLSFKCIVQRPSSEKENSSSLLRSNTPRKNRSFFFFYLSKPYLSWKCFINDKSCLLTVALNWTVNWVIGSQCHDDVLGKFVSSFLLFSLFTLHKFMFSCKHRFQRFFSLSPLASGTTTKCLSNKNTESSVKPQTQNGLQKVTLRPSLHSCVRSIAPGLAGKLHLSVCSSDHFIHGYVSPLVPVCEAESPPPSDRWEHSAQRRSTVAAGSQICSVWGQDWQFWGKCSFHSIVFGKRTVRMKWETAPSLPLPLASGSVHSTAVIPTILLVQLKGYHLQRALPGHLRSQHFLPPKSKMCGSHPQPWRSAGRASPKQCPLHVTNKPADAHQGSLSLVWACGRPQLCHLLPLLLFVPTTVTMKQATPKFSAINK